jgi:hypothetical protein
MLVSAHLSGSQAFARLEAAEEKVIFAANLFGH